MYVCHHHPEVHGGYEFCKKLCKMLVIVAVLCSFMASCSTSQPRDARIPAEELHALLSFASGVYNDSQRVLEEWRLDNAANVCSTWAGVSCDPANVHVVEINLSESELQGKISPNISGLSHLQTLDLYGNTFQGEIPQSIGQLQHLKVLNLSGRTDVVNWSNLNGRIPLELCELKRLQKLDLSFNYLEASIPSCIWELGGLQSLNLESSIRWTATWAPISQSIGQLQQIKVLNLGDNNFNGTIPPELCELKRLQELDLSGNNLEGSIPSCIWELGGLQSLNLENSMISWIATWAPISYGKIPQSIGQLQQIKVLNLRQNHLNGTIPPELCELKRLQELDLSGNSLEGSIPSCIWELGGLQSLDLHTNNLQGEIPASVGQLQRLQHLRLSSNRLTGDVPEELWTLSNLTELDLSGNSLHISAGLRMHSLDKIEVLDLSDCGLTGTIPSSLANLTALTRLVLNNNLLQGDIPTELGMLPLSELSINNNSLSGYIPESLGNRSIPFIELAHNMLQGHIPYSFGEFQFMNLANNQLTGEIPASLEAYTSLDLSRNHLTGRVAMPNLTRNSWLLNLGWNDLFGELPTNFTTDHLVVFSLRSNSFSGHIPPCIWNSSHLQLLDLSNNRFEGTLPAHFEGLEAFCTGGSVSYLIVDTLLHIKGYDYLYHDPPMYGATLLDLSGNRLQGRIPSTIGKLNQMRYLILSHNSFSRPIPDTLGNMTQLEQLDLSHNQLQGVIPASLASMDSLNTFSIAFNNLSGAIPSSPHFMTLYNISSFEGNPGLCGKPLPRNCSVPPTGGAIAPQSTQATWWDNNVSSLAFAISAAVSFIVVFWSIVFSSVLAKQIF